MKRLLVSAALLFLIKPVWATPSISTISSTAPTHGASMSVTGTGFTTFSTTVLTFDQFDSSFSSDWATTNNLTLDSSNQRSSFSVKKATCDFNSASHDKGDVQGGSTVARSWFMSHWVYFGSDWDWGTSDFCHADKWLANIKGPWRGWNPGGGIENFYFQYQGVTDTLQMIEENLPGGSRQAMSSFRSKIPLGQWMQWKLQFIDSSSAGVSDGSYTLWLNGSTVTIQTGRMLKEGEDLNKRFLIQGFENEWGPNETGTSCPGTGPVDTDGYQEPNTLWLDDVYQSGGTTVSRIEISTCSTYAGCPTEIQKPSAWSTTSATFTYNAGGLAAGATRYLYICDDTGTCSAGFNMGSSSGGNSPPSVDAGVDQTITLPADATLDATVTDDVAVLGSTWTMTSGTGSCTFGNSHSVDTTATFTTSGVKTLQIAASDGTTEVTDTVQITVNAAAVGSGGHLNITGPVRLTGPFNLPP